MAREYNWNVKNKASKGYEVCMYTCRYPCLKIFSTVYIHRKPISLCYNPTMACFIMKLKQGEIYINSVGIFSF